MYWLEEPLAPATVPDGEQHLIKADASFPEAGRFDRLLHQQAAGST